MSSSSDFTDCQQYDNPPGGVEQNGFLCEGADRERCAELAYNKRKVYQLRKKKMAVEEELRNYATFLAGNAHDLRTPLNAILGYSDMFLLGLHIVHDEDRTHDYASAIKTSAHLLSSLINDLLDVCKIDAAKLELREENIDVHSLVEDAAMMIHERARASGIVFDVSCSVGISPIYVDRKRLLQAILNLLSNAVKFTPEGGNVDLVATQSANGGVDIHISDNGVGMKEEDIPTALLEFGQVGHGQNQDVPSTGLGLPLARRLVELHGGDLRIQSEYGVGTTLTICIPPQRCAMRD